MALEMYVLLFEFASVFFYLYFGVFLFVPGHISGLWCVFLLYVAMFCQCIRTCVFFLLLAYFMVFGWPSLFFFFFSSSICTSTDCFAFLCIVWCLIGHALFFEVRFFFNAFCRLLLLLID